MHRLFLKNFSFKPFVLFLFSILSIQNLQICYSQNYGYKLYTTDEGLVQNQITALYQDVKGFIWIGTKGGLSRFNGYEFKNFTTEDGLFDNHIIDIKGDSIGNVWIFCRRGGVCNWNGIKMGSFKLSEKNWKGVQILKVYSNGILIVYNDELRLQNKKESHYRLVLLSNKTYHDLTPKIKNISYNNFYPNFITNDTLIFNKADNNDLFYFKIPRENKLLSTKEIKPELYFNDIPLVEATHFSNQVYVRTNNALFKINKTRNEKIFECQGRMGSLLNVFNQNQILLIVNDSLRILDLKTKKLTAFKGAFPDNGFSFFSLVDNEKNIWLGTETGLFKMYPPAFSNFVPDVKNKLHRAIWSVVEDNNKNIWLSSYSEGLQVYNGNEFREIPQFRLNRGKYFNSFYMESLKLKNGNLLFPVGNNMIRYDGKNFSRFFDGNGPYGVFSLFEDTLLNQLIVGANTNGIIVCDKKNNKKYIKYTEKGELLSGIVDIEKDKNGLYWLAGRGIFQYDGKSVKKVDSLLMSKLPKGIKINGKNYFFSFHKDNRGNMWLGSENGLFFYNYDTIIKINLSSNQTLITCIKKLTANSLIIGSTTGISILDLNKFYSRFPNVSNANYYHRVYDKNNGFLGKEAAQNGLFLDSKGQMWIPATDRLVVLNPEMLDTLIPLPKVHFQSVKLLNENMQWLDLNEYDESVQKKKPIQLTSNQNNLRFDFFGIYYQNTNEIEYRYKLEGEDNKWSVFGKERFAVYTNLHSGKYKFYVQAKNMYSENGNEIILEFTIKPPWYLTKIAFVIWIICIVLIISGIVKINTRRLKKDKKRLEKIIKERTQEVVDQKEEISMQAEELQTTNDQLIQLQDFKENLTSLIVHDLKAPLTSIIGLAEQAEHSGNHSNKTIQVAGKQMLNMVLNLLDINKLENSTLKLHKEEINIRQLTENAIFQIKYHGDLKQIRIENQIPPAYFSLVDTKLFERVLINILANAIKYSHLNSEIKITCEIIQSTNNSTETLKLKLFVNDYGIGIETHKLDNVFTKFYTDHSKKWHSSGLGLYFCKMVVEAHDEKIGIFSEKDKGSSVWFTIPCSENVVTAPVQLPEISNNQSINFTDDEINLLITHAENLKKIQFYQISDIRKELNSIAENTENISNWKKSTENASISSNEKLYENLIYLISEKHRKIHENFNRR